jgi:hypothetical protein
LGEGREIRTRLRLDQCDPLVRYDEGAAERQGVRRNLRRECLNDVVLPWKRKARFIGKRSTSTTQSKDFLLLSLEELTIIDCGRCEGKGVESVLLITLDVQFEPLPAATARLGCTRPGTTRLMLTGPCPRADWQRCGVVEDEGRGVVRLARVGEHEGEQAAEFCTVTGRTSNGWSPSFFITSSDLLPSVSSVARRSGGRYSPKVGRFFKSSS